MEPKDGPQDGAKDEQNLDVVLALEAPYRVGEPSTQATGTPAQQSAPATGTQPVGMAKGSSTPATGPRPFAWSGPRRRGRPRKYGNDGAGTSGSTLSPTPISAQPLVGSGNFPNVQPPSGGSQPPSSSRQPPSGSRHPPSGVAQPPNAPNVNWPEGLAEGTNLFTGGNFVPHVIVVNTGEDVSEKIESFYNNEGPQSMCVICATGDISRATLRQKECSGGRMTFEGCFRIVTLSGTFISPELVGLEHHGLSGGLSISLASADGRIIGGMLDGILIAASPVMVGVGVFLPRGYKEPKQRKNKSAYKPPPPAATSSDPMPSYTANADHPIYEGHEQSHDGAAAAADPMPSYTANVDHPIFEGQEQSHDGGAAAAGTSNDAIGSSSLSDLNLDDWADMNIEGSDPAGKSTTDVNIPPQGE